MLKGRTCGIAVGNYAKELDALKKNGTRVYFAKAEYAAGILEGLEHYGLLKEPEVLSTA